MSVFSEARETIADKLAANGVAKATLDPRAQPPCVLVDLPVVIGPQGIGAWAWVFVSTIERGRIPG